MSGSTLGYHLSLAGFGLGGTALRFCFLLMNNNPPVMFCLRVLLFMALFAVFTLYNTTQTVKLLEFVVFGSKAQRQKISSHFPVSILGSLLHPVDSVRNLGVWFDADFSFSEHIKRTCKACFLQMRDLRRIRKYLTSEVAVLAADALVSSRLDYCNSLFRGLSGFNQHKLQSIQNTLARIVTNHRKYAHVTPILQKTGCLLSLYFQNRNTCV